MKSRRLPEEDITKIDITKKTPEQIEKRISEEEAEKAERERRSRMN
jgi:hypothetical protein